MTTDRSPNKKNEFHNSAALNNFRLSSWGYDTQHNFSIYFIVLSRLVISPTDSEIGMNLLVAVFLFLCFRNLFCSKNAQGFAFGRLGRGPDP